MKAYQRYLEEDQAYEKQFAKDYIGEDEIDDILWDIKDDEDHRLIPDVTSGYVEKNKFINVRYYDRDRIINVFKEAIEKRFSYQGED